MTHVSAAPPTNIAANTATDRPPNQPISGVSNTASTDRLTMSGKTTILSARTHSVPSGATIWESCVTHGALEPCNSMPDASPITSAAIDSEVTRGEATELAVGDGLVGIEAAADSGGGGDENAPRYHRRARRVRR